MPLGLGFKHNFLKSIHPSSMEVVAPEWAEVIDYNPSGCDAIIG